MPRFLPETVKKIKNASSGYGVSLLPVAKASSAIRVGDVLIFKYRKGRNTVEKTVVTVRPVEKDARTGNSLLTCVKIDLANELTPDYIKNVYNNRASYGEDQYRTYIMTKIVGNIYKFSSYNPVEDPGEN